MPISIGGALPFLVLTEDVEEFSGFARETQLCIDNRRGGFGLVIGVTRADRQRRWLDSPMGLWMICRRLLWKIMLKKS